MNTKAGALWLLVAAIAIYWWFFEKNQDGAPTKDRVTPKGATTEKSTFTYQRGDYPPDTYISASDPGTPRGGNAGLQQMFASANPQYESGVLGLGVNSVTDPNNPVPNPLIGFDSYQKEPLANGVPSNTAPGVQGFTS